MHHRCPCSRKCLALHGLVWQLALLQQGIAGALHGMLCCELACTPEACCARPDWFASSVCAAATLLPPAPRGSLGHPCRQHAGALQQRSCTTPSTPWVAPWVVTLPNSISLCVRGEHPLPVWVCCLCAKVPWPGTFPASISLSAGTGRPLGLLPFGLAKHHGLTGTIRVGQAVMWGVFCTAAPSTMARTPGESLPLPSCNSMRLTQHC